MCVCASVSDPTATSFLSMLRFMEVPHCTQRRSAWASFRCAGAPADLSPSKFVFTVCSHKSVTVFVHGRSPSAASIKSDHMSLVLLLAASEGHVRLNYIDGSDLPIRNAGTATGNGRASVDGGLAR